MNVNIEQIAYEHGLQLIETTSEKNGYPRNLKRAIIGFENFKQAEELAKQYDLSIEEFYKKDGWSLYYRTKKRVSEPFENDSDEYGDDYLSYEKMSESEFFKVENLKDSFRDLNTFEEIEEFLEREREIFEEIDNMDENQLVITYCGRYYETIDKTSVEFYHDTEYRVIGLVEK
ncbi:hypothetical protein [Prevotella corporis]|uniref:hypothetical protein n=1 Tax=Prevotella corporis TaxID=28128 RepID=UPI0023F6D5E7|nr:hypothetical protein [Prevotella corporis]